MMQLRQYLNPSYAACFLWLKVLGSEIYNADSGHVSLRTGVVVLRGPAMASSLPLGH